MKKQYLFGLLLSLLSAAPVFAQTPEERGLEIAQEADKRDTGWQDMKANMTMILRNRHGQKSQRKIRMRGLEILDDGDKSLSIFDQPRDVKGTAFLSFTHATIPDDQWLYLPALKRVKRISSKNKSGPFMGSEFAYEDLTSQEVERYSYKWLRDEDLNDRATFVVERYPEYAHSGYTRQVAWVDQAYWQPQKIEFYDRKNSLLKTLVYEGYQQYLEQYWRPAKMHMDNHQTGKSTILEWQDYEFRTGLTARDFDKNSLKRAR
ncbi:outer membrane lipoprotein-sorting protein [Candidatus Albibeggiatoa sp. nov. BB20]|uniref:outer membrane lipoprotein-sorting protein n=1 Tax=Candidatus Albibeggiatoa sp. nov. BB20 TaxID=3162723 RepID=UPI003365A3CC